MQKNESEKHNQKKVERSPPLSSSLDWPLLSRTSSLFSCFSRSSGRVTCRVITAVSSSS